MKTVTHRWFRCVTVNILMSCDGVIFISLAVLDREPLHVLSIFQALISNYSKWNIRNRNISFISVPKATLI